MRFALNCYKHWAQLLLRQPGELRVTILIREGVTQGDPFSMVLYGIGDEEEERGGIAAGLNNLTIETAGTEEKEVEGLAEALEM